MPIRWPAEFHPSKVPVYISNEIDVAAPPEAVWQWLIRSDVEIFQGPSPELGLRSRFRYKRFGVKMEAFVEEFKPPGRLAWSATGTGLSVYHAWLIEPTPQGCHILTEETQRGSLARLGKLLFPRSTHEQHQIRLQALKLKAEN